MIFMFFANSSLLDSKVRTVRFSPKWALWGPKVRKVRIFMKIHQNKTFRSFRAPCENVALAQGILMVLGALFAFWSEKCCFGDFHENPHFSHFWAQKRTFLTFEPKSRFSAPKVTFGAKVRFGSSGSPRRGPGTAPDGSPEGASPGTPPNPARARKRLYLKLNGVKVTCDILPIFN